MEVVTILGKDNKTDYQVYIGKGSREQLKEDIVERYSDRALLVVVDERVYKFHKTMIIELLEKHPTVDILLSRGDEEAKKWTVVEKIYKKMYELSITPKDLIIAIGGGTLSDAVGFAAATFKHGIDYLHVPTTLLAQADSSVGGKVSIDLGNIKSMVGLYAPPLAVYVCIEFLGTLSERDFYSGMAAIVKFACIGDPVMFGQLQQLETRTELMSYIERMIIRCHEIKKDHVEKSYHSRNDGHMLSFGHTMANALKSLYESEDFTYGEAMAYGMYYMTVIGEKEGITRRETSGAIKKLLDRYKLPTSIPFSGKKIYGYILNDEKMLGEHLNLVFISKIGSVVVQPTDKVELYETLFLKRSRSRSYS